MSRTGPSSGPSLLSPEAGAGSLVSCAPKGSGSSAGLRSSGLGTVSMYEKTDYCGRATAPTASGSKTAAAGTATTSTNGNGVKKEEV